MIAFKFWLFLHGPGSSRLGIQEVTITAGMNAAQVAKLLHAEGVIADEEAFRLLCWFDKTGRKLKAGSYAFLPLSTPRQVLDQIVAVLMYSEAVEEVFVEDVDLRRRMAPIFKQEMAVEEQLERETRAQLGHVQEGTRTWEVEYRRVMEEIRRRKGL